MTDHISFPQLVFNLNTLKEIKHFKKQLSTSIDIQYQLIIFLKYKKPNMIFNMWFVMEYFTLKSYKMAELTYLIYERKTIKYSIDVAFDVDANFNKFGLVKSEICRPYNACIILFI